MDRKFNFARIEKSGIEFTKWQRRAMADELPAQIYWIQPDRLRLWNIELIKHLYLVVGGDRSHPDHQKLVEQFLATLPTSA